ncbi:helix-turn-helix domain-containing protein [Streptomyces sp. C10-9-1]|uniref:helix-turn-helix domain-containing protein n=1 Tax=Streptomyces sp. C10-9-1 TaxID=1859285 RepID=UPI003F4A575D
MEPIQGRKGPRVDPQQLWHKRIEAGLSQAELARRTDMSRSLVSMVEKGAANFSVANLKRVADVLSCSIYDLMPEGAAPATIPDGEEPAA